MRLWFVASLLACSGSSKEETGANIVTMPGDLDGPTTTTESSTATTTIGSTSDSSTGASSAPCDTLVASEEGALLSWNEQVEGQRAICEAATHAFHAPKGTEVEIGLLGWSGDEAARLQVLNWNGEEIAEWEALTEGDRVLQLDGQLGAKRGRRAHGLTRGRTHARTYSGAPQKMDK